MSYDYFMARVAVRRVSRAARPFGEPDSELRRITSSRHGFPQTRTSEEEMEDIVNPSRTRMGREMSLLEKEEAQTQSDNEEGEEAEENEVSPQADSDKADDRIMAKSRSQSSEQETTTPGLSHRSNQVAFIQSQLNIHNTVLASLINKDSGSLDAMKASLKGIMDLSRALLDIVDEKALQVKY